MRTLAPVSGPMRATIRSWRSRRLLHLQFQLDRFRRTAAQQRAGDRRRAGDPGRLLAAGSGLPQYRPALAADHRIVAEPAAARRSSRGCRRWPASSPSRRNSCFRIDGKHIWNPAGFAIVVLLFTRTACGFRPAQWGTSVWFAALLRFFAILVLHAARRSDIALFFLGSHAALLFARASGSAIRWPSRCINCRAARS